MKIPVALLALLIPSLAHAESEFQHWHAVTAGGKVADISIKVEEEFRSDEAGLVYQHSDLGVSFKPSDWLSLGVNYRHIFELKSDGWRIEQRPHLNVAMNYSFWGVASTKRLRFELRSKDELDWRLRLKSSFEPKSKDEIWPFLAIEPFLDKDGLSRVRTYGGFKVKLHDRIRGTMNYIWQASDKDDRWDHIHVLATKVDFKF